MTHGTFSVFVWGTPFGVVKFLVFDDMFEEKGSCGVRVCNIHVTFFFVKDHPKGVL